MHDTESDQTQLPERLVQDDDDDDDDDDADDNDDYLSLSLSLSLSPVSYTHLTLPTSVTV